MAAKPTNNTSYVVDTKNKTITGGNGVDTVNGSKDITADGWTIAGGNGADLITGSAYADIIWGDTKGGATSDNGADTLKGGAGADQIHGGNGADFIQGDDGADKLWGDRGGDTFNYVNVDDSEATAGAWTSGNGDEIFEFKGSEGDKLNLTGLYDEITGAGAPDKLTWSDSPGDKYGVWSTGGFVYADVTGDGTADLAIKVSGVGSGNFIGLNHDPLVAAPLTDSLNEDDPAAVLDLLEGATDSDGDALFVTDVTYKVDAGAASATVPTGLSVTDANLTVDTQDDSFDHLSQGSKQTILVSYTVTDKHGGTVAQTQTITINGVNDGPVAADTTAAVDEDAATSGTLSASDDDDDAALTFTIDAPVTGFALDDATTGAWTFDAKDYDYLAAGAKTDVVVNYTVTDNHSATDTGTLTITVTGVNDAATIGGDDKGDVTEDGTLIATGALTIDDVDGGGAEESFKAGTTAGKYGSLALLADGSWTYTLDNDDADLDSLDGGQAEDEQFTVKSFDGTEHIVTVTVHGADEAPTVILDPVVTSGADPNDFDTFSGGVLYSTVSSSDLNKNNILRGTTGDDSVIDGQNGDDAIYGLAGNDTIDGGNKVDTIYGGSGNDKITGGQGVDAIYGGSGSDTIAGSEEGDTLVGGYGADTITGDQGVDVFKYLSVQDRGDTITDFVAGTDVINLAAIDAVAGVGDQAFAWGGTTATANGVWYSTDGTNATVYADTDGVVGTAELWFNVTGVTVLASADFVL